MSSIASRQSAPDQSRLHGRPGLPRRDHADRSRTSPDRSRRCPFRPLPERKAQATLRTALQLRAPANERGPLRGPPRLRPCARVPSARLRSGRRGGRSRGLERPAATALDGVRDDGCLRASLFRVASDPTSTSTSTTCYAYGEAILDVSLDSAVRPDLPRPAGARGSNESKRSSASAFPSPPARSPSSTDAHASTGSTRSCRTTSAASGPASRSVPWAGPRARARRASGCSRRQAALRAVPPFV